MPDTPKHYTCTYVHSCTDSCDSLGPYMVQCMHVDNNAHNHQLTRETDISTVLLQRDNIWYQILLLLLLNSFNMCTYSVLLFNSPTATVSVLPLAHLSMTVGQPLMTITLQATNTQTTGPVCLLHCRGTLHRLFCTVVVMTLQPCTPVTVTRQYTHT